jgi:hypothetical protein
MFTQLRRFTNRFFNRTRTINNEPLNRVSLIVIILIDIFILVNVFIGLDDISHWYISPEEAYPCYFEWKDYRTQTSADKDYEIIRRSLPVSVPNSINLPAQTGFQQSYQQAGENHLGNLSQTCLTYGSYKDKVNTTENQRIIKAIDQKQEQINQLEQTNRTIRSQYNSTLLERIAGQSQEQSINSVDATRARQTLDQNNSKISTFKAEITDLKQQLLAKPEVTGFITLLKDEQNFQGVETGYKKSTFWYPTIQLIFQACFLLPLIVVALFVYNIAQKRRYGLIALMSWHLLVIFFIPLIIKVFQFLQVGAIFQLVFDAISRLLGQLLFLISYLYILLIPLLGFGIIKFFQRVILNPKNQATNRVQGSLCLNCAKRIRHHDSYCPYCGYYQYNECQNCHQLTYKHLPYCKQCGYVQDGSH